MKADVDRWVDRANEDLSLVPVAIEMGALRSAVFHSHEAVEKMLKALWIHQRGELAEKTHNLPYLARRLELELTHEQQEFLRKLYWELIPSRYPEGPELDESAAQWYYEESVRLCEWLRQRLS